MILFINNVIYYYIISYLYKTPIIISHQNKKLWSINISLVIINTYIDIIKCNRF